MNERIVKLFMQSVDSNYIPLPIEEHIPSWTEKFAELIVRECMVLCKSIDETDTQYRYDYRRGVLDCADTIKQHFGVEE